MTSEERRKLIIEFGQDICDFCEKRFPYIGNCNDDTCRCAEDWFHEKLVKPYS